MISCREADSMLSRRLDGELSPDLERDLSAHLEACPACRALEVSEARTTEALRSALAVEPAVLRSIREIVLERGKGIASGSEGRRGTPARPVGRRLLALAAGVSIGVLLWLAFVGGPGESPTPGSVVAGSPRTVFLQTDSSDSSSRPVDGDPMLRWQTERLKAILEDGDPSRMRIRIEVERDRDLVVPVSNPWY